MTNKELSIILRLRDEATKRLEGVRGNLQRFANAWKQNWLAITAAVTASIMALRKAWDMMEIGAKAEQVEASFRSMARAVGEDAAKMKEAIQEASKATTNFSNVAGKVSALMAQGLNMNQITALMRQARAEAQLFGETTEEAFGKIAGAISGGLVTTLRRSYGLQLSLAQAVEDYAEKTGIAAEEVQKLHMAQAIANHILDQGASHMAAANLEMMTQYEQMQKLRASWTSFTETVGQVFLKVFEFLKATMHLLASGWVKLSEGIIRLIQGALWPFVKIMEALGNLPGKVGESFKGMAETINTSLDQIRLQMNTASQNMADEAFESYSLLFAKIQEGGAATGQILLDQMREMARGIDEETKNIIDTTKEAFNVVEELAKQSARNIQNAFANFFFRAFTGELRSLKEVFADFGRSVLQMISNIIARLMVMKMLTAMAGSSGKIFGVAVSSLFHQGGMIERGHGGFIKAHSGLAPDEVPIIAQTGEGVLSRKGMRALGGSDNLRVLNRGGSLSNGGVTINVNQVIQAWDAQDVYRNRKMLSASIADEIRNNAGIRKVIKGYT